MATIHQRHGWKGRQTDRQTTYCSNTARAVKTAMKRLPRILVALTAASQSDILTSSVPSWHISYFTASGKPLMSYPSLAGDPLQLQKFQSSTVTKELRNKLTSKQWSNSTLLKLYLSAWSKMVDQPGLHDRWYVSCGTQDDGSVTVSRVQKRCQQAASCY